MPQKRFLNRRGKQKDSEFDNLDKTPKDSSGEEDELMGVQDRRIYIRKEEPTPSVTEIVQEELEEAGKKTRTANQYLKYVNALLDNRLSKLEKIKKKKEAFDAEIEALHPENLLNFERLSNLPFDELNSKEIARLINAIKQEKSFTVTALEHFQEKVKVTEAKLKEQDKKIQEIHEKLKQKVTKEREESKIRAIDILKEELKALGEIYGMEKLTEAITTLKSSGDEAYAS